MTYDVIVVGGGGAGMSAAHSAREQGASIDTTAHVLDIDDQPIAGLFAAGEMVGGIFYFDYPGASRLMSSAVFGRIAGREAAKSARG